MSPPFLYAPSHLQYIDGSNIFRCRLEWTALLLTPRTASPSACVRAHQPGRGGACVQKRLARLVPLVNSGTVAFWTNYNRELSSGWTTHTRPQEGDKTAQKYWQVQSISMDMRLPRRGVEEAKQHLKGQTDKCRFYFEILPKYKKNTQILLWKYWNIC